MSRIEALADYLQRFGLATPEEGKMLEAAVQILAASQEFEILPTGNPPAMKWFEGKVRLARDWAQENGRDPEPYQRLLTTAQAALGTLGAASPTQVLEGRV